MGKYSLNLSEKTKRDLKAIQKSGDKNSIQKVEQIFNELSETPAQGIGKPELLKYKYAGLWSRRINQRDRLIYKIEESIVTVFVISAKGHYDDK
ncbi:Txe/YoeB family addiction module toxin [Pedobacter cryophilus]|uniref:Putative mRNA interferase YoeB n=1 Tax=Pedobacter cryophilus TaxID=2571271 RepID=A0A4U1BV51_9SPHI|nr:Txe/YoeB family addiction module toxin [Pedobacter cryophilus]TKB96341.1 Txe/YoeB family addiction module toxin [Pedobacter cryophilus]